MQRIFNSLSVAKSFKYCQAYRGFHLSQILLKIIVENTPALGESITEGSVSKWVKSIGEEVKVDDVIVIVETDKVTVEIKSLNEGILAKQFTNDRVVVGEPLFSIETESKSFISTESVQSPVINAKTTSDSNKKNFRHPSIRFLGKRIKIKQITTKESEASSPAVKKSSLKPPNSKPSSNNSVDFTSLKDGALFGRPKLSLKEIEAIESGGAI